MILNYPGNKKELSKKIIKYIPENFKTYAEPFSGSFFMYFNLPYDLIINTKNIYNDSNYNLVKVFKYIKEKKINDFINFEINEDKFNSILEKKENTELEYLILLLCSDSIINFKFKETKYFDWLKLNIHNYYPHVQNIDNFDNYAYDISILKYDSEDTFFYLDPPYVNKESFYGIKTINHNLMADLLKNIKGKFILSYSYFNHLYKLYDGFNIINIHNGYQKEYIIKNY
jgi:DNA adenine methylase